MPTSPLSLTARHAPSARRPLHLPLQILGGSLVMALAAHAAVPFWPVPLTLQTLALLGLGAAFGPVAAAGAILAWIVEGVIGLPVFAAGAGAGVLLGPTGGYILGYLPAVLLAGLAARPGWRGAPLKIVAAFLAAEVVLFACGVGWLAHLVGWQRAVAGGLTPFLLGEALKIALATAGALALTRRA